MTILPRTPELIELAKRVIWFEPPEQALQDFTRFTAYTMTYGRIQDIALLEQYASRGALQNALQQAPPGIFDGPSWHYWHVMLDMGPVPERPVRLFS